LTLFSQSLCTQIAKDRATDRQVDLWARFDIADVQSIALRCAARLGATCDVSPCPLSRKFCK